ncbi:unnamed protein product [Rotaria magnacalcarata]
MMCDRNKLNDVYTNDGTYVSNVVDTSHDIPLLSNPNELDEVPVGPIFSEYEQQIRDVYSDLAAKVDFSKFVGEDQWSIVHLPKSARNEPKSRIRKILPGGKDEKNDGKSSSNKAANQKGGFLNRFRSGVSSLVRDENNLIFGDQSNYDVMYYDDEEEDGIDTDDLHRYAQKLRELEDNDKEVNPEFLVIRNGKTSYAVEETDADGKMTLATRKPIYDRFGDQATESEPTEKKKSLSRLRNPFSRNKNKDNKGINSPKSDNDGSDTNGKRTTKKSSNKNIGLIFIKHGSQFTGMTYTKHRSTAETLSILDSLELDTVRSSKQEVLKKFGWDDNYEYAQGRLPKYKKMMMIIWQIFEEPRSSTVAKVVTVISIFFILVSILSFVLQTLSMFRITEIDFVNVYVNKTTTDRTPTLNRQQVHPTFDIVEWICNSWFIFEIVVRFIVSPCKKDFSKSILNIIDFLATLWFFFTWALIKLNVNDNEALDLLSTIRIMRLFKLFNHHPGLKVIITSMKYSSSVLWLLIFFVLIAVAIFASLIYYAERMTTKHPDENMFTSIPDALWFNMITMSTIGYGDYYPKTMLGMLIGAVATVAGVLIIDLPMPIIVESFANFYTHLRARSKLPKTRRKIGPAETLMKKRTAITTIDNVQSIKLLGQASKTSMFGSKTMINNNRMSSMA